MRRHSAAQRGASRPTMSSGERGTHSSEWEGTPPLRRERHAHRWPSGWGEQCWLYQQRALGSGTLIPRNEWTFRRSEGSGILIGNPLIVRGVMLALPLQWWPEWLKIQEDPQKPPRGLTSRPSVRQFENTEPAWSHHRSTWLQFLVGNSFLRMRAYNATYIELWRAENSFLRMRRNSDAQQGAACS